jgi:hypothetical protein
MNSSVGVGGRIIAAVLDRLVDADNVATDVDVELIATPMLNPQRSCVGGVDQC